MKHLRPAILLLSLVLGLSTLAAAMQPTATDQQLPADRAPAAETPAPDPLDDLFLPVITQTGSMCTVSITCQTSTIQCSSASGNCRTAQGGDCVKCDGVVVACCSSQNCADCQDICYRRFLRCEMFCFPPNCDQCEVNLSNCLAACPC